MMKFMKHAVVAVTIVLAAGVGQVRAGQATDEVRSTVDEVVRILSDKEMKKSQNQQKRRELLKAAIGRSFDYQEMTKRAMAANWKQRTPAEQAELVNHFSSLLEKTYAGKIESYNNEKVVYLKEILDGNNAEVKSKIISSKGDEYTIDYRLIKSGNRWSVYDVVIEGVSLVSNYRTQFNKILKNEGYPELVKRLKSKGDIK